MQILIAPNGEIRYLYDESFDLSFLGSLKIRRGSHVEPTADGQWTADLGPVSGPVLGPFPLRSHALQAERAWLETQWLETADF